MRELTRNQILTKSKGKILPFIPVTVNFGGYANLGFVVRAAGCFGAKEVHVIGSKPNDKKLRQLSSNHSLFIDIKYFSNPIEYIEYYKKTKAYLVALELTEQSKSLHDYRFKFDRPTHLFMGHETTGVPVEILKYADILQIPIPGFGSCLNTSQAGNIAMYEYTKQYEGM